MATTLVKRSKYGALANFYDGFLTITGFKKGMENFLDRIPFEFASADKVLDAGTGTGLVAFYLAKRFPNIEIYASDLDLKMLKEAEAIAKKEGINNVNFFQNDLNFPGDLYELERGKRVSVSGQFFKAVITSGVLGLDEIECINFQPADFPANLSRVAILAKKY